jgi:hypothetical protein
MPETTSLTDLVAIPSNTNAGVTSAKQATMLGLLGNPRSRSAVIAGHSCRRTTGCRVRIWTSER